MKQKKLFVTVAIAVVTLFVSCAKDDFQEIPGLCPQVITTNPLNSALEIPLNQLVTVTFNKPINPATLTPSSFKLESTATSLLPSVLITGVISYSGVESTFTPTSSLSPNTTYAVTITTAVKDLSGNALQENYVGTFSTGAILQPVIVSTSPTTDETNVELDSVVKATFNMPMDFTSLTTATFTLKQGTNAIAGVVTNIGNDTFFTPNINLTSNTIYTATITTGAKNTAGTAIANDYVWNFTTRLLVAPRVISTDPSNNATNVLVSKVITATFDMTMNPSTINGTTFILKRGTTSILGVVTYSGLLASFTPSTPLLYNSTYTATLTSGAQNSTGVAIDTNYSWNFTTVTASLAPNLGAIAPFGAFGGNAGIANQGLNRVINGSLGTTAASTLISGFHDATSIYTETPLNVGNVTNGIYTAPPIPGTAASFAIATQGLVDANAAYISISPASMPGGIDAGAGELGGLTLPPGIYKSASGTFNISNGNLTLDAQGNPNATWIFQTAAGLIVGIAGPTGAKSVLLINGALSKNVFWYVGSAATINGAGGGTMVGTIIANSGVTFSTPGNTVQTILNGRAISLVASVTMVNTTITIPQ